MVVVVTVQTLHTADKLFAQKDIIVWAVSQVAMATFNAMEVNTIVQAVRTVHRLGCKQMPVPGNVSLGGIASLGVQYRNKQSVDMGCQSLFIVPAGSDSPKTDVGNGYTYCPITSPQGIHCSNMTREAKVDCKEGYACENGNIINVYWGGKVQSTSFGTPAQIQDPRFAVAVGEVPENTNDALVKDTKLTGASDVIRVTFGTGSSASASENRVAPFASYSIVSVECVATKALTSNAPFQFKLVDANSEGVSYTQIVP